MQPPSPQSLIYHFASLEDPSVLKTSRHNLIDVLVLAICGVICGADDWVSIAEFGEAKKEWVRGFRELPNGIPSQDTFGRTFSLLSPAAFQESFAGWICSLTGVFEGLIAIDGKTLRRSHDRRAGKAAIHRSAMDRKPAVWSVRIRPGQHTRRSLSGPIAPRAALPHQSPRAQ